MKPIFKIVLAGLLVVLSGCASVSVETAENGTMKIQSMTLWKDISDLEMNGAEFSGSLGSSGSDDQAAAAAIVCIINPALCEK